MTRTVLWLSILLMIFLPKEINLSGAYGNVLSSIAENKRNTECTKELTAMEALDKVKDRYAANFEKVHPIASELKATATGYPDVEYYYKLPEAEYYLVYEGMGETGQDYLIHLYEFVLDEPDTGLGHTYTYGWYIVNKETGKITDQTNY